MIIEHLKKGDFPTHVLTAGHVDKQVFFDDFMKEESYVDEFQLDEVEHMYITGISPNIKLSMLKINQHSEPVTILDYKI
jgi:hypothetical protein